MYLRPDGHASESSTPTAIQQVCPHIPCLPDPPSRRSARSGQRIADRRCALRRGGGKGLARALGSVLAHEAFQGCCPIWRATPEPAST